MPQTPFGLVWKVLREHWKDHVLLPFIISICLEFASESLLRYFFGYPHNSTILAVRILVLIISLSITYFIIIWQVQKKDAKYVYTSNIRNILDKNLDGATGYFAVSIGDIKRWFVPSSLMYFLDLLRFGDVEYERIFVFLNEDESNFDSDIHQGKSMANVLAILHTQANINNACIMPEDFNEILDSLSLETKEELKIRRTLGAKYKNFRSKKLSDRKVEFKKSLIKLNLDFAYVKRPDGDCVLLTDKKHEPKKITTPKTVAAYKELVTKIERKIYSLDPTTNAKIKLKEEHTLKIKADLKPEDFKLKRLKGEDTIQ